MNRKKESASEQRHSLLELSQNTDRLSRAHRNFHKRNKKKHLSNDSKNENMYVETLKKIQVVTGSQTSTRL